MRTIILAAGRGTRLKELGEHLPKCMISLNNTDETIIGRLIKQVSQISDEVIVVGGHKYNILAPYLSKYTHVRMCYNGFYKTTSNMTSLYLAFDKSNRRCDDTLIIDADTVMTDKAWEEVKKNVKMNVDGPCTPSLIYTVDYKRPDGEWRVITDELGRITEIETNPTSGDRITSGITFFSGEGISTLEKLCSSENCFNPEYKYWDDIYLNNFESMGMFAQTIRNPIYEIDTIEDIEKAVVLKGCEYCE